MTFWKFLLFLIAVPALGQTTTITGTIKDLHNSTVTSGQISFKLNAPDSTAPGTARFVSSTVYCSINSAGQPVALDGTSPCVVTSNTALSPSGTSYAVCVQPYNVQPGGCFNFYALSGQTVDISTIAPTPTTLPTNYAGTAGPPGPPGPPGSGTAAAGPLGSTQIVAAGGNAGPSDVTTLLNTIPIQHYTNTAHPQLAYFDAALHNCQKQVVIGSVHADSRSVAAANDVAFGGGGPLSTIPATWGARWVNRIDAQLKRMCGSHGSGIQPFRWGTGNFSTQGLNEFMYSYIDGITAYTPSDTSVGPYQGSDSMVIKTTQDNVTIGYLPQLPDGSGNFVVPTAGNPFPISTLPYDHLRCYVVAGTGFNPWTMYVDGVNVGTCGVNSGSERAVVATSSGFPLRGHSAKLVCVTHPCAGYALEAVAGTTGAKVNNLSIGSSSLESVASTSSQRAFEILDPDGPPNLLMVNHVTNEINQGISLSTFQTSLANEVTWATGLSPHPASILFIANMIDDLTASEPIGPYYAAILTAAQTNNTALVDMRNRWGFGLAPCFLFGDGCTHEGNNGNGEIYSAVAGTIVDAPFSPSITVNCFPGFINGADSFGRFTCSDVVPVEAWPMNEGSGSTFTNPINPSHTATATGVTWGTQAGFTGTVATFAGGATAVASTTNASFTATQPFTVCTWISPSSLSGALAEFYSTYSPGNGGLEFYVGSGGNLLAFISDTATASIGVMTAGSTIAAGAVYHVCVTYSGSQTPSGLLLYVNGVPVATTPSGTSIATVASGTPVSFGVNANRTGFPFSGKEAYTRVFNAALSSDQIAREFSRGQQ